MASDCVKSRDAGYIYVLSAAVKIGACEVVKIGMTARPVRKRVRELTTASPVPLTLAYSLLVENVRELERDLHNRFAASRLTGGGQEYFSVPASEVIHEIEKIAAHVSAKRARQKRDEELDAYMREIGAGGLHTLIKLTEASRTPFAVVMLILIYYLNYKFFDSGHWLLWVLWPLVFAPCFFVSFVTTASLAKVLRKRLELKFGKGIEEKHDELIGKYPLAYPGYSRSTSP